MPILKAMCSSHGPSLFTSTYEGWERINQWLNAGHPQAPEIALEGRETVAGFIDQTKANFAALQQELADFDPEAMIFVIGDQREWFDGSNIPNMFIYTGSSVWGTTMDGIFDQDPVPSPTEDPRYRMEVTIDTELSQHLLTGLVREGFDVAFGSKMNPQSKPLRGVPHGVCHPAPHLLPRPDVPLVLLFVNVDDGPPAITTGGRCIELGRAVARLCKDIPKRIAIYGSGGMSHNPLGLRTSWVDVPLDDWFMEQVTNGTVENLKALFSFRSENFSGGVGELRCWTVSAAAIDEMKPGHRARKVGYFPARKGTAGFGWISWPTLEQTDVAVLTPL